MWLGVFSLRPQVLEAKPLEDWEEAEEKGIGGLEVGSESDLGSASTTLCRLFLSRSLPFIFTTRRFHLPRHALRYHGESIHCLLIDHHQSYQAL